MVYRVLLIMDDASSILQFKKMLEESVREHFEVVVAKTIEMGIKKSHESSINAIIADIAVQRNGIRNLFDQINVVALHTPLFVLVDSYAEALNSMCLGAQGYFIRHFLDKNAIPQALQSYISHSFLNRIASKEHTRAENALNSIGDAVLCTDVLGNINYLNSAAESITGWNREQAKGRSILDVFQLINAVTREPSPNMVEAVIKSNKPQVLEPNTLLVCRDGREIHIEDSISPIHDFDNKLTGVVIVFHDASEAKSISMEMAHRAQHDFLTNLPNRLLLSDRISQAISLARRAGTQLSILFLDVDNFKKINDAYGHKVGDILLQKIATQLNSCVRSSDTVSRHGGDEFVILLTGWQGENAALTAQKIINLVSSSNTGIENQIVVGISIGISIYPKDGKDAETLLAHADTAMYAAKEKGKNSYQFYQVGMSKFSGRHELKVSAPF